MQLEQKLINMATELKSSYTFVFDYINSYPIGSVLSINEFRTKIVDYFKIGQNVYNARLNLTRCIATNYLTPTDDKDLYVVSRHFPAEGAIQLLMDEYQVMGATGQARMNRILSSKLDSDTINDLRYNFVRMVCEYGYNYIQGEMVKHVLEYKESVLNIYKIMYLCDCGLIFKPKEFMPTQNREFILSQFVEQNNLDYFQIKLLRFIQLSQYSALYKECESYVNDIDV